MPRTCYFIVYHRPHTNRYKPEKKGMSWGVFRLGKDPREWFMCVAFDTWVKRLTQTCSVPPDIKREETNTKGSNIKSFRLWTIGHRTFYGYVLCLILGIDMFSDTATRILSLSQRPFTTQFGKGCCVSTSTKTPRKRIIAEYAQRWFMAALETEIFEQRMVIWYTKSNPSVY